MREDMKTVIADTFTHMLDTEDLDKITVKSLIEKCQISRQTFYYHFHDIMDVLDWAFKQATQELTERSLNVENQMDAVSFFVSFVTANRRKFERLLYSRKWVQIEGMLVESAMMYLDALMRTKAPDLAISYDDREVLLRFYAGGMVSVLLQYAGINHVNEEKLIFQIQKIITGKLSPDRLT